MTSPGAPRGSEASEELDFQNGMKFYPVEQRDSRLPVYFIEETYARDSGRSRLNLGLEGWHVLLLPFFGRTERKGVHRRGKSKRLQVRRQRRARNQCAVQLHEVRRSKLAYQLVVDLLPSSFHVGQPNACANKQL